MWWNINKIERRDHLQIAVVVMIIVVTSIWIPTKINIMQYNDKITKGTSRVLTFVKSMDMFVRDNFKIYNNSPIRSEFGIYDVPSADAASSLETVNQGHTNSSQPGLIVGTYPVVVAINPVTKKIYVTDEFSNTVSVISGTSNTVESTITVGNFPYGVAINPMYR
jgi:YVTN family beta-propeller protein